ncbi:hypothetical protein D3C87_1234620 [compost metagenome]
MHARLDSNLQVEEYPISDLRARLPDVSLPVDLTNDAVLPEGFVFVNPTAIPSFDSTTHRVVEVTPTLVDGKWVVTYDLVPLTASELEQVAQAVQSSVTVEAQLRMDTFARTRFYDSMLSACSYATSTVPRLKAEGQYCVDARDATWETLYGILGEVIAGTRPVPRSLADIEDELPVLAWPAA